MPVNSSFIRPTGFVLALTLLLLFFAFVEGVTPMEVQAVEKKEKKPLAQTSSRKETTITHATIQPNLKKAQEYIANKEFDKALKLYDLIYTYSGDILSVATLFEKKYDKAMKESSLSQSDKENVYLKLKRVAQLSQTYKENKLAASYGLGYVYSRKGDGIKAKKYLMEAIESSSVSFDPQSLWMKSRKLLLELYELEGEF